MKVFQDIYSPGYRSTPRWERRLAKWWNKNGRAVLVAAVITVGLLLASMFAAPSYSRADVQQLVAFNINHSK